MPPKDDRDSTLRDMINHFDLRFQRADERIDRLESKVEDLAANLKLIHEDLDTFAENMYDMKQTSRPHTEQRLDRLEHHAKLPPMPVPVSPV
jgi:chromosome segregation ATPase